VTGINREARRLPRLGVEWPIALLAPYAARMAKRERARRSGQRANPWEPRFPLTVFLVHWIIIQGAAWLALRVGTPTGESPPYGRMPAPMEGWAGIIVAPFRQWDGLWYTLIAQTGYVGGTQSAKAAFWPLYPWLMRLVHQATGLALETAGYLISNIAFAGALILLWRLIRLDFTDDVARRTLWAMALFPTAFFFQAVYTESLFLLLAVGALLAARLGNWWTAGIVGIFAALTRSYGLLLGLPFLFLLWDQYGSDVKRWWPSVVPASFPALGPALFGWHLQQVQGNWRAFIDVQGQWNRYQAMPWETMRCAVQSCFFLGGEPDGVRWDWLGQALTNPAVVPEPWWRVSVANSDVLELLVTVLFLALAAIGLKLLPPWQSAFAIPALVIPLFSPSQVHALMSIPRFILPLFPLFIVLALVVRPSGLARLALVASVVLLVLFTIQFAQWYWVS
jgi:hypothetical protein